MSNRSKVLRTLLVLGIVACIAGAGVFSAFSSKTENTGNEITAGTVELEDNDGGGTLYKITGAKPGDTKTSCIKVTYKGSLAATVKLFTATTPIGALGPYENLKIESGTQTTSAFPECVGFTPAASPVVFEGTLSAFATEHNSYANGISTFPGAQTKWEATNSVVYRFTATLSATVPNTLQGATTNAHTFTWEAQNQ
jgi:predicted ribosomally synthesized peptide with SipW-like signal peptide